MYCKNCGKPVAENSKFCRYCGAEIVREGEIPEMRNKSSTAQAGIQKQVGTIEKITTDIDKKKSYGIRIAVAVIAVICVVGYMLSQKPREVELDTVKKSIDLSDEELQEDNTADTWADDTLKRVFGEITAPCGFYYTTPDSRSGDSTFVCIYQGENEDTVYISIRSILGNELNASPEHPIELKYNADEEKWVGDNGESLRYDEDRYQFVYSDSSIEIYLHRPGMENAWSGPKNEVWGYLFPEGVYVSDDEDELTVNFYHAFYDIIIYNDNIFIAEMDVDSGDTYSVYANGKKQVFEMSCSDVTSDTIETLTITDTDTGESKTFHKDSSVYDLYLNAAQFAGEYKIVGGVAGDNSYITLEYDSDHRFYECSIVWQGETIVPMEVAFPWNISEIESKSFCMQMEPYINGEQEYIETFIPRFGDYFYLYPEE